MLNLDIRGDGWSSSPTWQRFRNPLGRMLGGLQSRSGRFGGKRDIFASARNQTTNPEGFGP